MFRAESSDSYWVQEIDFLRTRVAELEARVADHSDHRQRECENLFRLMADAAPVMLWTAGADALCTYFNKRWLEFRGRRIDQELGNGWVQGVHPDDLRRCMEGYLNAFRARRDFQLEYRVLRADGEYRWLVVSGVPRLNGDNSFLGYVGSGVELGDRARPVPEIVGLPPEHMPLTDREKQVLILVAEGKSTKEVACALGISYKTADSHRTKIMEKLDLHETASLVRWAIRHKLVHA